MSPRRRSPHQPHQLSIHCYTHQDSGCESRLRGLPAVRRSSKPLRVCASKARAPRLTEVRQNLLAGGGWGGFHKRLRSAAHQLPRCRNVSPTRAAENGLSRLTAVGISDHPACSVPWKPAHSVGGMEPADPPGDARRRQSGSIAGGNLDAWLTSATVVRKIDFLSV